LPVFINSPINLRLDYKAPDHLRPELREALEPLYNAFHQILSGIQSYVAPLQWDQEIWSQLQPQQTIFPHFHNRLYLPATETIAFGAAINLFSTAGTLSARNANATTAAKPCHGFCSTTGGLLNGVTGEVILGHGLLTTVGAFAMGNNYWLHTLDGQYVNVPPVADGNIEQFLGVALNANDLFFNCSGWMRHKSEPGPFPIITV